MRVREKWIAYRIYQAVNKIGKEINMLGGIKGWFGSKKGMAFLLGLITLVLGDKGLDLSPAVLNGIVAIVSAYVVGQGVADHGKHRPK